MAPSPRRKNSSAGTTSSRPRISMTRLPSEGASRPGGSAAPSGGGPAWGAAPPGSPPPDLGARGGEPPLRATVGIREVLRGEYGRILATLIRLLGDFDVAEEALQEAFATALEQWPLDGTPANPAAWLVGTARHKAIDHLRRKARLTRKQEDIARHIELLAAQEDAPLPEDRLRLIFTCCHPALATEAQVALTLRTLGGLSTEEIARAFLVSAPT